MRRLLLAGLLFAGTNTGFCQALVSPTDEAALLSVWKVHLQATNDHAKVVTACQEFQKKSSDSPLGPVAGGIAAWHLLKLNDTAAASAVLENMLSPQDSPIGKAGSSMAKRWLTRLDREKVRLALKSLYRASIEFPSSLDAMKMLPEIQRGPFTDRWGQTWSYHLTEFKSPKLKDLRGQRYELRSAILGADSDFGEAIKVPYTGKINLKPVKIVVKSPGRDTVEFVTTDEKPQKSVLTVGAESGGLSFPFTGSSILILSDGDHWALLPAPR